jgi:Tfp pilus assembly protein PilF
MLYFHLGVAYDKLGDGAQAAREFKEALKYDPEMHEALNYLAYMYAENAENLDNAEKYAKKALALSPDNGAYLDTLGWIYYKMGYFDKALAELEKAIKTHGEDPVIRDHLGDVYYSMQQTAVAVSEWEKSLEIDPGQESVKAKLKEAKTKLSDNNKTE